MTRNIASGERERETLEPYEKRTNERRSVLIERENSDGASTTPLFFFFFSPLSHSFSPFSALKKEQTRELHEGKRKRAISLSIRSQKNKTARRPFFHRKERENIKTNPLSLFFFPP